MLYLLWPTVKLCPEKPFLLGHFKGAGVLLLFICSVTNWHDNIHEEREDEVEGESAVRHKVSSTKGSRLRFKWTTLWFRVELKNPWTLVPPNLCGRTAPIFLGKLVSFQMAGQKWLPSVFTVSVFFFLILHFPPRICDAGSSLRLWCLASTLKIAMNHRWLFSGPTMLHIISLHSTLLLSFYFCFSFHSHLVGFQRHQAKTSSFSFFCLFSLLALLSVAPWLFRAVGLKFLWWYWGKNQFPTLWWKRRQPYTTEIISLYIYCVESDY